MKLTLTRRASIASCTIGDLLVDGQPECYTLEDEVRERIGVPVADWKIKGDTAIPQGTYRVIITPSVRFKRDLPLLLNVPGFEGIRIHPGNTAEDTEGCLLVGNKIGENSVLDSRAAFLDLFIKIQDALNDGQLVHIEIKNA